MTGTRAKYLIWLPAAAVICCSGGNKKINTSSGKNAILAVHLVKIIHDGETFIMKGYFEGGPDEFVLKAENEIGVSIFTATWDGRSLSIKPAGKMIAGMIPFDLRNIAIDIWRIISEWSKSDIKKFNKHNDPDLPEDGLTIEKEKDGVVVKRIMKGKGSFAHARYYGEDETAGNPFLSAPTIRYVNELLGYEITILQTFL